MASGILEVLSVVVVFEVAAPFNPSRQERNITPRQPDLTCPAMGALWSLFAKSDQFEFVGRAPSLTHEPSGRSDRYSPVQQGCAAPIHIRMAFGISAARSKKTRSDGSRPSL